MRQRAFSLAEALLTGFLLALVLGLVAVLGQRYSTLQRFGSQRDLALSTAQFALERMRSEVGGALQVSSPSPGPANLLDFQKIYNVDATRIPTILPNPLPGSWDPKDSSFRMRVIYRLDTQQNLVRDSLAPSGTNTTSVLAQQIQGLQFTLQAGGAIEIRMSVTESTRVFPLSTVALLRIGS